MWNATLQAVGAAGVRVLRYRASAPEQSLDYVGIADLFEAIEPAVISSLDERRRRAIERVMLNTDAPLDSVDPRTIYSAVLEVLRRLSAQPLVIAIDDWRWLDRESTAALAFAARRFGDLAPPFLLTQRLEDPVTEQSSLEAALRL